MDALRDDTLLGVESEDHDWGRRWQITAFCLTLLFLLYACAIGFAFVILLFYAVMRGTVRFCMLQFASAFCRKGPVNVMHASKEVVKALHQQRGEGVCVPGGINTLVRSFTATYFCKGIRKIIKNILDNCTGTCNVI